MSDPCAKESYRALSCGWDHCTSGDAKCMWYAAFVVAVIFIIIVVFRFVPKWLREWRKRQKRKLR